MPVRRQHGDRWFYRATVRLPDGKRERIFGTPTQFNLPNTKVGAQEAERRAVARVLECRTAGAPKKVEVPTLEKFVTHYLEEANASNKPSTVDSKRQILNAHVVPTLGARKLDRIGYAEVQDLKLALLSKGLRGRPSTTF